MVAQWFTYSLVGTDGVDLGAEHHRGEDEEEEALKAQEYEEDDCCWRGEGTALWLGGGEEGKDGGTWRKRSDRAEEEGSHEELLRLQSHTRALQVCSLVTCCFITRERVEKHSAGS